MITVYKHRVPFNTMPKAAHSMMKLNSVVKVAMHKH